MDKTNYSPPNNLTDKFHPFPHFSTLAIHAGQDPKQRNGRSLVPPISLATTFEMDEPGIAIKYDYTRSGNPIRNVTEKCLAAMENAKHSFLYSSGMAAVSTMCTVLKAGDHLICMEGVYEGSYKYLKMIAINMGIETTFVDASVSTNVGDAIKSNTKMVWLETPTNPLLTVVDIEEISKLVHVHTGIIVVVDNSFMSSYFQRPLELGADVSFQSLTKYMNGHSDVLMGSLVTNDDVIADKLNFFQRALGSVPSPFDCFLLRRGLQSLALRMQEHMINGLKVAKFLENNFRVERVIHPGLPSHPQHLIAKKQCRGYSGMISFYIVGGETEAKMFLKSLKLIVCAGSLGGYESLAGHPASMSHALMPLEQRLKLGITESLIRLSVGLEDVEDIIADLQQALEAAVP